MPGVMRNGLVAAGFALATSTGELHGHGASAAHPLATGTPPPCQASRLSATAAWQGATGSLAGGMYLTNTGPAMCMLGGHPQLRLLDGNGHVLPVAQIHPGPGSTGTEPVAEVDLVPGGRGFVFLFWSNWCGGGIRAPLRLVVELPRNGGHLSTSPTAMTRNGAIIGPRCDAPQAGSHLSIGDFEPPSNGPADSIRALYTYINQGQYSYAYIYLAPPGRPGFTSYAAGYRSTAHVSLDRMAVPNYRIRDGGHDYTCIGLQLTARMRDGSVQRYGGWLMTAPADILPPGSRMIAGAALVLPSEAECAAHIPPVMYASSLNRAGELFLVVPRRAYRLGERVRVTVGSWNPGLLSLTFPQSGCPAGNPLVLVENRAGRILYPSTPSPLFCPTPGNPLTLASHQSFHRTLTVTIRGPYLRAAAIAGDSKSPGYWTAETSRLRIQLIRTS